MAKIAVIGSLNMDVVAVAPRIPVRGETIIGSKSFTEPGGKGANQAYAAARLGGDVSMFGCIGHDDFGQRMRRNLADVGCEVTNLRVVPGISGVALIFVAVTGQNSIIVVPGANHQFLAQHIDEDAVHLQNTQVVLLQLETPLETVVAAAREARRCQARVILDPAPAPVSPLPKELFALVDILTPNETEGAILADFPPARLTPTEAFTIAQKLQSMGSASVIMKLGDQGCLLVEKGSSKLIPAPIVNAVDTTAAGDVFNAGLAVGLGEGMALAEACQFAVAASALSVTRLGAQIAVPSRAEVDEFARAASHS